ncbi:MAG: nucleotidyltransferase domain-containing protein [Nitrospirae bacterium]|uniref:nucleotidyltransferase domain-containing protein n=1 Tax=Candidatus Magnetobacterium casense TaxID=1455061 RepID=UPI00058C286B|nr:nucleotidyltransferase domain-containing protein [Candidatus Magnetobacterium casensis]MBF0336675.1 nucleotidyltransferase domain-containing protein [Nitrospirota bacterium]
MNRNYLADLDLIEVIKDRLVSVYDPKAIYLFGSYAWGKPTYESDIDLLVIIEMSDDKPYKRPIKGLRVLRDLKIPEDILVYTVDEFSKLSDDMSTLCYKIKHEGIKLY